MHERKKEHLMKIYASQYYNEVFDNAVPRRGMSQKGAVLPSIYLSSTHL